MGSDQVLNLSLINTYQSGVIQTQVHRKLKKEFSNFLKPHDLTMMEWFALGLIKDAGNAGLRLTELSKNLQTTLPYTTNLINSLMYKRFVIRDSDNEDSRAKKISLVAGVGKKCDNIEADLRKKMKTFIYGNISPKELSTYIKVLYKIANGTDN